MAIDYTGKVTTTGLMNQRPSSTLQVPDMSGLTVPEQPVQQVRQPVQQVRQPIQSKNNILERLQNVTAEDINVLAPFLSPSVKSVLVKIMPEISELFEKIGTDEETIPLKASIFTSLPNDIQSFIIESSTQQMDTNNVPLDTAPQSQSLMAKSQDNSGDIPQDESVGVDISQDLV